MIEQLSQCSGNISGCRATGKITKEDYAALTADVAALLRQENSIWLLLDLESFKGEEINTAGTRLSFTGGYRKVIPKMAIVGEKKWQNWRAARVSTLFS